MRKGFLIVLAVVLVAALAAPAMAGTDINGFYRAKAYMSNFKTASSATGGNPIIAKDAPTDAFVEQRLRLKFTMGEENVKAVVFFEIDYSAWGDAAGMTKNDGAWGTGNTVTGGATGTPSGSNNNFVPGTGAGRNTGGALGADRINLETKNVYLWFKLPNTPLDFTVGMQNQTDAYAGLLWGAADMAGIFMNGKIEPVTFTLGWAKLYENYTAKTDDLTLYVASAKFAPTKDLKVGGHFYYLQDDTQNDSGISTINPVGNLPTDPQLPAPLGGTFAAVGFNKKQIYTLGTDVTFNAGPATISGFALYQWGKRDYLNNTATLTDVDISGYALDARVDANLGPGKGFFEALYISGGDNTTEKYKSIVTLSDFNASPGGNSAFGRTDMQILLFNNDDINMSQAMVGTAGVPANGGNTSPGNAGRGIWHLAAGYTMPLGAKLTSKVGLGYLSATELLKADKAGGSTGATLATTRKGEGMGTEINANVNYNIMKGLDFGLYGAYVWLGDFYKSQNGSIPDPDNPWETHMRINYAF
jgi:hypothetical protein